MQADKITLNDLAIFHPDEEQSVFHHLNHTLTNGGRDYLRYLLAHPLDNVHAITDTQKTIRHLTAVINKWPVSPTNGTNMVLQKFFETQVDTYPETPQTINSEWYRFFHKSDFSLTQFTVQHALDFLQGMQTIARLTGNSPNCKLLSRLSERIETILNKDLIQQMIQQNKEKLSTTEVLTYANYIRFKFKAAAEELINIHAKLDAYLSLAKAGEKYGFCFPDFLDQDQPMVEATGLFHFMLPLPVAYRIHLSEKANFLFLTGANMAGKSTFIKASGLAVFLAHIGMGVPAQQMKLSYFNGILSNIQIADNIARGESFFFNEVQRIKNTITTINDGKKWLILIDELFKGTNQQDAVKCSTIVIEGLLKLNNALFILSTHLYEIGDSLKKYPNIQFRYFETAVKNDQLIFSYQLKEGISNDRLGYLILKREGVVDLLEKL